MVKIETLKPLSLEQARLAAIVNRLPLTYSCLAMQVIAVATQAYGQAPLWFILIMPIVITPISIIRGVYWLRHRNDSFTHEESCVLLKSITIYLITFTFLCIIWFAILIAYADGSTRNNIMFSLGAMMMFVLYAFLYMPVVGMLTVGAVLPLIISILIGQGFGSLPIQIMIIVGTAVLVRLALIHASEFDDLVRSRLHIFEGTTALEKKRLAIEELNTENFRIANTDMLTELANRRRFFADLSKAFERAERQSSRLAVGVIDLDGFKPINDNNGHLVGDKVLRAIARRLEQSLEGYGEPYRLGGDEFAFMLDGDCREERLRQIGARLIEAISQPVMIHDLPLIVGCSIGFSVFPEAAQSAEMLYERADYALFHAKSSGRGAAVIFNEEHERRVRETSLIEGALRSADLDAEIHLVFQPIVDSTTNRTLLMECLARWNSPILGPVSPAKFIPIAEQSGLISSITPVLLRKALAAAVSWPADVGISFNLSGHDVSSTERILRLIAIVEASSISPTRLDFEVTETALMMNLDQAIANLKLLKATGAHISLDDFGTGYSSLSQIQKLPLDKIKVDASFVRNIASSPASQKIVRSIGALTRDLQLGCVVEGVETPEQLVILRAMGCTVIQGYLYSKPLPGHAVTEFVTRLAAEPTDRATTRNVA